MFSFTVEQRFIVTGASSGIGEGVALLLNKLGATVIGIGRNQERLHSMQKKALSPNNIFLEQKDLTEDIAKLPAYIKSLRERYGKFQGMACCAGISHGQALQALDMDSMKNIFDINYFAPVFLTKGFTDRRNNNGKGSSVVSIASSCGVHCEPGMTSYSGAKGALIATMQSIARELAPKGLRINCVSPSLIETDMADDIARSFAEGKYPFGLGNVEDVANFVAFLLSDKSKWITAQNYIIDCGYI